MANWVKCPVCEERFDRDKIEYEKAGRRYYHIECYKKQQQKEIIVQKIHSKISSLCGSAYSKAKVDKQIKSLLEEGKTEANILTTLEYWYDILGKNPKDAAGGIGIVSYVYGQALDYFYRQEELSHKNENINIEDYISNEIETVVIPRPKIKKPKRIEWFDIK